MNDRVIVGKFGRPHGLHGEVRFWAYNPETELLDEGRALHTDKMSVTVKSSRFGDRFAILKLAEVTRREEAEALTNAEAWVNRDELPEPDPDEFYLVDIIGFEVRGRLTEDEDPEVFGILKGFLDSASVEVMIVTGPRLRNRLLVPMNDIAVDSIDHEQGIVHLHPLDRWFPEDELVFKPDES